MKSNVPMWCLILVLVASCAQVPENKREYDPAVHTTLGMAYLQEGDATKALKEFLTAVEGTPDDPEVHIGLAQAYFLKRAYLLAEKHFLKAIELSKGNPQYRNNLGALYLDMQRWDDAILQFRTAADNLLFDRPEVALTGMGVAQSRLGQYPDAVESFKLALRVNLQYPQAHLYLGQAYFALNQLDAAVESYKRAVNIVPQYLEAHYRLALAYLRQKKPDLARTEFETVISISPKSEQARLATDYLILLN